MDDNQRDALYDRTGMNFFVGEIDGEWHGGWFRINGRQLEVSSGSHCHTVTIVDPDLLTDLLRKTLAELVHASASADQVASPREGQDLVSASLHRTTAESSLRADSTKERGK